MLLLDYNYAKNLGLFLNYSRFVIILAVSLIAGILNAFAGPISFIGLAEFHIQLGKYLKPQIIKYYCLLYFYLAL